MALLARARWPHDRSDRGTGKGAKIRSLFAPAYRYRMEPGRPAAHGTCALHFTVSILCGGGAPFLPAISALSRHILGRTIQYRLLRAPYDDDGAGYKPRARRIHPYIW